VVEEVLAQLPFSQKITFAPSHRVYNRSEQLLPAKLVDRCRGQLDKKGHLTRRTVFFGVNRVRLGGHAQAYALLQLGYPIQVAADALKFHRITFKRWGLEAPQNPPPPPKIIRTVETLAAGFKHCQELHPGSTGDAEHYYYVGTAIMALQDEATLKLAAKWDSEVTPKSKLPTSNKRY